MTLDDVFGVTHNVSWEQECARAVLVFFYGLVALRVSGRRIFGKWAAIDILVAVVAGSNLSRALTGGAPLWGTLAATTVFVALHWTIARLAAVFPAVSSLVEGRPTPLMEEGRFNRSTLIWHGVTEEDLDVALRQKGLEQKTKARLLILEPNGKFSVLERS